MQLAELADTLIKSGKDKARVLVAIAGPPGSGKSTLAEALQVELVSRGESAAVVPMDGFHLDNSILEPRGLLPRKGAPETFDADGFVAMVSRVKNADRDIIIPVFDRHLDKAIAGAAIVQSADKFIIIEGNYLLLKEHPWSSLVDQFDQTVFLDTPMEVLETRLIERWLAYGHDREAAKTRALSNDIPNANRVKENSSPADTVIT